MSALLLSHVGSGAGVAPPNQALQRAAIGIKCPAAGDLVLCSSRPLRARAPSLSLVVRRQTHRFR